MEIRAISLAKTCSRKMKNFTVSRPGESLNKISLEIIAILNLLTDSNDTTAGDLTENEIGLYADNINGEII